MSVNMMHKIPSLKDATWLKFCRDALADAKLIPGVSAVTLHVQALGSSFTIGQGRDELYEKMEATLVDGNGLYIKSISYNCTIAPQPNQHQQDNISITVERVDPEPTATLRVTFNTVREDHIQRVSGIEKVVAHFQPIDPSEAQLRLDSKEGSRYLKTLDAQMQKLQNQAIEITERVATSQQKQAEDNTAFLGRERQKLQEQHDKRLAELDEREGELKKRVSEIDLLDAKASRRKIRGELRTKLEGLAKSFAFTKETDASRHSLYRLLLLGTGVALVSASHAVYELFGAPNNVYAIVRLIASSALFSGLLIYAIRWQSAWVRHRTAEEMRLLNTAIDLERASWVLESLVEFKKEGIDEMPDALLEAVTRNLFGPSSGPEDANTPADDLADLLRSGADSVKLKLGDSEVTFDRKALRKLGASGKSKSADA